MGQKYTYITAHAVGVFMRMRFTFFPYLMYRLHMATAGTPVGKNNRAPE